MGISWKKSDLQSLAEKKLAMADQASDAAIAQGVDVELSTGTEHINMDKKSRSEIDGVFQAVTLGATEFPYHLSEDHCVVFSATDIATIYATSQRHNIYHSTYTSFLKSWIRREKDKAVLGAIEYGSDLPEDLAADMQKILDSALAQMATIVGKFLPQGVREDG